MENYTYIDPKEARYFINTNRGTASNFGRKRKLDYATMPKSMKVGLDVYNDYDDDYKTSIKEGRKLWGNNIKRYYLDRLKDFDLTEKDIDNYINESNPKNFNNDTSQKVNGLMHSIYPYAIIGNDKGDNKKIPTGNNVFFAQASTRYSDKYSPSYKEDWDYLNSIGFSDYMNSDNKHWNVNADDAGNRYYTFYDTDNNGYVSKPPIKLIKDAENNEWHYYDYDLDEKDPYFRSKYQKDKKDMYKGGIYPIGENTSRLSAFGDGTKIYQNGKGYYPINTGNSEGIRFIPYNGQNKTIAETSQANRLYADGGSMGQIPMGEQEDYNYVANGGSHEQNPMGGVPYGYNQDGSQNMVEQGEVSVGDEVFSDRTQVSPELCQQLGLREGTTHAQAMAQIEQLRQQGQIGDQEFQEVQQIIFQDQESQKQNSGSSYQQGQVGNEGIQPEMVNAYAYGGYSF